MSKKNKETTIKDLIEIFLPKLWIILLVGVLLAGLMSVYSVFFKKDTYTASAEIYVYKSGNMTSNTTTGDIAAAEEMVNIYERAIGGDEFLEHVCIKLAEKNPEYSKYTPEMIKRTISISKVDDTPNFIIKVTTGSRTLSADLAYVIVQDGIASHKLEEIIKNNHSSSIITNPKDADNIQPNSKNVVRNMIIAFFAGIILAAICVWIFASFDVTIRNAKKIEDNVDVPVLGVIPRHDVVSSMEVKE